METNYTKKKEEGRSHRVEGDLHQSGKNKQHQKVGSAEQNEERVCGKNLHWDCNPLARSSEQGIREEGDLHKLQQTECKEGVWQRACI